MPLAARISRECVDIGRYFVEEMAKRALIGFKRLPKHVRVLWVVAAWMTLSVSARLIG